MTQIAITTLVENTALGQGVRGEHGLAFWVETDSSRVLFDTGQTADVLFHNADCLGIDLSTTDAVVLSHGHYDHTGGLGELLKKTGRPHLMLHPDALIQRYTRRADGSTPEIGICGGLTEADLRQHAELIWTEQPTEVSDGLMATGGVPRVTEYEDTGGDFYLDEHCTQVDPIADDQALFSDTADGTVVLLGCAHAGIINTLHYIRELTNGKAIHAVIGGMHLVRATGERLDLTVQALHELGVRLIAPAHCTGAQPTARLCAHFPEQWQPCPVSTRFQF